MSAKSNESTKQNSKSTILDGCLSLLAFGADATLITSERSDGASADIAKKMPDYDKDLSKVFDAMRDQVEKPLEGSVVLP